MFHQHFTERTVSMANYDYDVLYIASGDVVDKMIPKLTPTATFESNYIALAILGVPNPIAYPAVPLPIKTLHTPGIPGFLHNDDPWHEKLYPAPSFHDGDGW